MCFITPAILYVLGITLGVFKVSLKLNLHDMLKPLRVLWCSGRITRTVDTSVSSVHQISVYQVYKSSHPGVFIEL